MVITSERFLARFVSIRSAINSPDLSRGEWDKLLEEQQNAWGLG